jgi:hypothetical protein
LQDGLSVAAFEELNFFGWQRRERREFGAASHQALKRLTERINRTLQPYRWDGVDAA